MKRNSNILRLWLTLALVLCGDVGRGEPGLTTSNCQFYTELIPGAQGTGSSVSVLVVNDWRFQFVGPKEWSVKYDPQANTLTLLSPDLDAGIRFKLQFDPDQSLSASSAEQLRSAALSRWNAARNFQDYRRPVGGVMCVGLDFECPFDADAVGAFRVLQVPFARGMMAVEMISSDRKFAGYDQTFNSLLSTLRIKPAVKLEGILTAGFRRSL